MSMMQKAKDIIKKNGNLMRGEILKLFVKEGMSKSTAKSYYGKIKYSKNKDKKLVEEDIITNGITKIVNEIKEEKDEPKKREWIGKYTHNPIIGKR